MSDTPEKDQPTPASESPTASEAAVDTAAQASVEPGPAKSLAQIESEMANEFIVDEATDEVLRLHLDKFEGPFEVLLYLIKSQEIDIFDIPIVTITEQYLRFLEVMREERLDVAGDFLVMAATLVQIKSKMILPVDVEDEEEEIEEEDPRLDLVEKLLEYRKFKDVSAFLDKLEQERADWYTRRATPKIEPDEDEEELLEVSLFDLTKAFKSVLRFITDDLFHNVQGEGFSVDEKVEELQSRLDSEDSVAWVDLFKDCRTKVEAICYFLAILELCKMNQIRAYQHASFADIRLFKHVESHGPEVVTV